MLAKQSGMGKIDSTVAMMIMEIQESQLCYSRCCSANANPTHSGMALTAPCDIGNTSTVK
jgi:hypothetical protein